VNIGAVDLLLDILYDNIYALYYFFVHIRQKMFRDTTLHGCCITRDSEPTMAFTLEPKRITLLDDVIPVISGEGVVMAGSGFFDKLKSLFSKGKAVASKVDSALHGETGTAITNLIGKVAHGDSHKSGFAGERHVILQNSKGRPQKAEWAGPGTNIVARLARGDEGISGVDRAAKRHDLLYAISQNVDDVRRADLRFVGEVNRTDDTQFNKKAALAVIKSKMALEKLGVAKPSDFTTFGDVKDPNKIAQYKKIIAQTGLGKFSGGGIIQPQHTTTGSMSGVVAPLRRSPPSHRLKMKLLRNIHKAKK
jgi:hypothetical protein